MTNQIFALLWPQQPQLLSYQIAQNNLGIKLKRRAKVGTYLTTLIAKNIKIHLQAMLLKIDSITKIYLYNIFQQ